MSTVTLGGERLGSGKKEKIHLHNYERSTHDLGYVWRSSMSAGTLVPFMKEVGLPGDSFDINLNAVVKTLPTLGPMFGSYKVQLDVFQIPIRLYQGKLHMNMLGIGMKMAEIKLPIITIDATTPPNQANIDNWQINSSCIFSYLDIRGIGYKISIEGEEVDAYTVKRDFNAIPYLAYFDIYKNYYANKQEEIGVIIHNSLQQNTIIVESVIFYPNSGIIGSIELELSEEILVIGDINLPNDGARVEITYSSSGNFNAEEWEIGWNGINKKLVDIFTTVTEINEENKIVFGNAYPYWGGIFSTGNYFVNENNISNDETIPELRTFPLENIDKQRQNILEHVSHNTPFTLNESIYEPYQLPLKKLGDNNNSYDAVKYSKNSSQEGLLIKTYQSDLFNNWISTEWIDGENGITAITNIDTTGGYFSIDTLNLSRKVYDMLNRIAVSGGSYDDWLDATYTHERMRSIENPMYCGGLSKELVFDEVFSQSAVEGQPLGTLAGRGVMTDKHKGGSVKIKVDEPSYIMGIISITPRIDYSQGNKWDVNLKTMDDFHKPALDEIGFQDLITDQMAWFDTGMNQEVEGIYRPEFKSAGKQPAWINYMTNVNQVRGDFAMINKEMFMVLNRRYDMNIIGENEATETPLTGIKDLTTYIDPSKFNFIFAETKLNAMNFWTQIKVDITARRKMSAKVMPNL